MKNIIILLTAIFSSHCKAQTPIIDIKTWSADVIDNMYLKDIDNNFNQFEGTWLYTNGNTSLKIILVKKVMQDSGDYFDDVLIGEYQYIENGVEKFNSLNNINTIYNHYSKHKIYGNWYKNSLPTPFSTVVPNETRLSLTFKDIHPKIIGDIIMHRILVNGQPALETFKSSSAGGGVMQGDPVIDAVIPDGDYIFIKQP